MSPRFGSLFSGIGGIDLGLERAGWDCAWQVEWDRFCQHVLGHHWPDVPRYGDITRVDWTAVEPVDLVAGGFPCQPVSSAGKQRAQDDPRWLWPEFARCISVLRPRYVFVENVRNLLRVNGGTAFGEVIGDLADLGYDAEWHVVSAADVGAPHKRDRLWIVAHTTWDGRGRSWERTVDGGASEGGPDGLRAFAEEGRDVDHADEERRRGWSGEQWPTGWSEPADGGGDVADANRARLQGHAWDVLHRSGRSGPYGPASEAGLLTGPGSEGWWAVEPNVGRVAHGVSNRVDRLRALGNAVVPQVPEIIGRRLLDHYLMALEDVA